LAGLVPAIHAFVGVVFKMWAPATGARDGFVNTFCSNWTASNLNPWQGLWKNAEDYGYEFRIAACAAPAMTSG